MNNATNTKELTKMIALSGLSWIMCMKNSTTKVALMVAMNNDKINSSSPRPSEAWKQVKIVRPTKARNTAINCQTGEFGGAKPCECSP